MEHKLRKVLGCAMAVDFDDVCVCLLFVITAISLWLIILASRSLILLVRQLLRSVIPICWFLLWEWCGSRWNSLCYPGKERGKKNLKAMEIFPLMMDQKCISILCSCSAQSRTTSCSKLFRYRRKSNYTNGSRRRVSLSVKLASARMFGTARKTLHVLIFGKQFVSSKPQSTHSFCLLSNTRE